MFTENREAAFFVLVVYRGNGISSQWCLSISRLISLLRTVSHAVISIYCKLNSSLPKENFYPNQENF